jgi:alpha,alpha-trehalase
MTLVEEAKAVNWDGLAVTRGLSLRVCDVGVQSILVRADRDLLVLARELGRSADADLLESWIARSSAAFDTLRGPDGIWRSLDLRTGILATDITSGSFLPLYARVGSSADTARLVAVLETWRPHIRHIVPSTDPTSPSYDPVRYWRGPVWLVVNRMIADGFAGMGRPDLAERLASESRDLVAENGLSEYFDPRTGVGLGGRDFSWSAAMWLQWLAQAQPEPILTRLP